MGSILQAVLMLAALVGVVLAVRRRVVHDRWWVPVLIGLIAISINGVVVPLGGLFLLVPVLAQPLRRGEPTRP